MFACVEQMCQRRTDIKSSKQIPAHCLHLLKFLYDSITHKLQKNTSGGCIYVRGVSAAETHAAYILQSYFKVWMNFPDVRTEVKTQKNTQKTAQFNLYGLMLCILDYIQDICNL